MPRRRASGAGSRRYLPLLQYLTALPPAQTSVQLPFAALEAILGRPLAVSARATVSYWTASSVARDNWQRAGWTARLDRRDRAVTFTRR